LEKRSAEYIKAAGGSNIIFRLFWDTRHATAFG